MIGGPIVILGAGFVGVTTAAVLGRTGSRVVLLDVDNTKVEALREGVIPFFEPHLQDAWDAADVTVDRPDSEAGMKAMAHASVTLICVGTPTKSDGTQDLTAIESAVKLWATAQLIGVREPRDWGYLAIRSTVLPGVTRRMDELVRATAGADGWDRMLHMPEFLAEGTAVEDTEKPIRTVFGWVHDVSEDRRTELWWLVGQPASPTHHVKSETAALIKYSSNVMLSARLTVLQELAGIAERCGADMVKVSESLADDERIGAKFLDAGAGWGGSCFPKDTSAIAFFGTELGADVPMLRANRPSNMKASTLWVYRNIPIRLRGYGSYLRVAWLGVTFKPGTSDTRESPSMAALDFMMRNLVLGGVKADVRVHDPGARFTSSRVSGASVVASAIDAVRGADVIVVGTAWPEYRGQLQRLLAAAGERPVVLDSRNLWRGVRRDDLPDGAVYIGFGRQPIER